MFCFESFFYFASNGRAAVNKTIFGWVCLTVAVLNYLIYVSYFTMTAGLLICSWLKAQAVNLSQLSG